MPSINSTRRKLSDQPAGGGIGHRAVGGGSVDRKLGALPVDFRLQGASGQPSTSADSGYSRNTIQRVNKGYEAQKSLEDIPDVSWLRQNAERLNAMGLTPRLVVEMYRVLNEHSPRSDEERRLIAEMNRRVLRTRREIRTVTRLALLETASQRRLQLREYASSADGDAALDTILRDSDPDLSGDPITKQDVEAAARQENLESGILSCNSSSLEILQTFLAITGVVGDLTIFFNMPVGIAADMLNACINLICGNYFYAMLDLVAIVPFAGDLGKIFYAKRLIKTLGLAEDMEILKAAGTVAEQVKIAVKIIDKALGDQRIGPKTSKIILGLRQMFVTAEKMALRLSGFLKKVLDRTIEFLEGIQASAEAGSATSKAVAWAFTKMPLDVLALLKKIRSKGIPDLKQFMIETFGTRQAVQKTVSKAEVTSHTAENLADETDETPEVDDSLPQSAYDDNTPPPRYSALLRGQEPNWLPAFVDVNRDGIPDDQQRDVVRQAGISTGSPYLREATKKQKRPRAKTLSLSKALAGDDSVVDETSTVAGSLGPPGKSGAGGYVIPLGMKPTGPSRKRLDSLVPGYEFLDGKFPYSR